MDDGDIKIETTISKEKIVCSVCLNCISGHIYRCTQSLHLNCESCALKLTNCPMCRCGNKPVRDQILEKALKPYKTKRCLHPNCKQKILEWDQDHAQICKHLPTKCRVCKREISSDFTTMITHYEEYCDHKFVILDTNTKRNKFKISLDGKHILLIIDNASMGIMFIPNLAKKTWTVSAFSSLDEYIGEKFYINTGFGSVDEVEIVVYDSKNITKISTFYGNINSLMVCRKSKKDKYNNYNNPDIPLEERLQQCATQ